MFRKLLFKSTLVLLLSFSILELTGQCPENCSNDNIFIGGLAGNLFLTGTDNVYVGNKAGQSTTIGLSNVAFGNKAGHNITSGKLNTYIGKQAGYNCDTADRNTFVGALTGNLNSSGEFNTFIGQSAGYGNQTGSHNVFLGWDAGPATTDPQNNESHRLYINNENGTFPLIYGEFDNDIVKINGEFYTFGDAGIGTSFPTQRLDVNGAIRIGNTSTSLNGSLRYNGNNFQGYHNGQWISLDKNVWTQTSISAYYMAGKIGIGTINPNSRLHINAATNEDALRIQSNGSSKLVVGFNGGTTIGAFTSAPADGLYVDGNTGLGILSPTQKLSVDGAISISNTSANTSGTIRYNGTNFQGYHNGIWKNLDEPAGISLWSQNGSDAHYTAGRIGIGTTSPNSALHIDGLSGQNPLRVAISGQTKFHVSSNGGVSIGTPSAPPGNGLAVSGNVGIGTTSATQKLTVVGDASITGALVAPSDERLKENIEPLNNALEIVKQLQPKTYSYQADKVEEFGLSDDVQFGLIAQELEKILPQLVTEQAIGDEDGNIYKGIEYAQLIPILLQAIKDLENEKEYLTEKLNSQDKILSMIVSRLDELEDSSLVDNPKR